MTPGLFAPFRVACAGELHPLGLVSAAVWLSAGLLLGANPEQMDTSATTYLLK